MYIYVSTNTGFLEISFYMTINVHLICKISDTDIYVFF